MIKKQTLLQQLFYWLIAFSLLAVIYGTAYGSYYLGIRIILILLPVHMCYFYLISAWVLPRYYFREKYVQTVIIVFLTMLFIAVLYRFTEIFIADPFIYRFYVASNSSFSWPKHLLPAGQQLQSPVDFVNAIERSNSVVWICVTLKLFILWHERKQAVLQTELNFLKGQLHPHFLFNCLNNLYALSLDKAPQTPDIILGLSNILRYVLYECNAEYVTLKRDIEVLNDYIRIEKLRYEDRLELNVTMDDHVGDTKIAPLLMLPLVENAFKHGAAETTDIPWVNIELCLVANNLTFKVANSKPEQPVVDKRSQKYNGKIGLLNLQKRLEHSYPGKHSFHFFDETDCFVAELQVQLPSTLKA